MRKDVKQNDIEVGDILYVPVKVTWVFDDVKGHVNVETVYKGADNVSAHFSLIAPQTEKHIGLSQQVQVLRKAAEQPKIEEVTVNDPNTFIPSVDPALVS